ncbi:MAG: TIGR01212 family radical SAM protein [Bacteroidales bacterium]|nr:TIGR01212 family radical SAM protein [Bacteroidales bacterium]
MTYLHNNNNAFDKSIRPYNSYSAYFKKIFGQRIQKLSIDAGFTCPNRDGRLSFGGCTFCDNNAFNPSYCSPTKTIKEQIEEGISFHKWRYNKVDKYLAYFQPHTNTYAPLKELKQKYEEALSHPNIIGLVIGTRPDCVDEEKLDYIATLAKDNYVAIEFGIESIYDRTLKRINRGHNFSQTKWAIKECLKRNIKTGGHIIFGLPKETIEDMLLEAKIISELNLDTIKFHQLQLFNNTAILDDYKKNPEDFTLFSFEEYREFIIDFLELLSPNIVIERFSSETPPRFRANYGWGNLRNEEVVSKIEQRMKDRKTYQGRLYKI